MKSLGKALKDGGGDKVSPSFNNRTVVPALIKKEWSSDKFLMQLFKLNG